MPYFENFLNLSVRSFFDNDSAKSIDTDLDDITVQIGDSHKVNFRLHLDDKLSKIRKILKRKGIDEMDSLLFAKKVSNGISEITREEEEERILKNIINEEDKILYLKFDPKPNWRSLNDKHKLDFGRTMVRDEFKKANMRAFIMKDCELTEIVNRHEEDKKEVNSNEDNTTGNILLLAADSDLINFAKLGISIESSKLKRVNRVTNSIYDVSEYSKVSLKFKTLKPTPEFIKEIEDAIRSKDPRNFKKITEKF